MIPGPDIIYLDYNATTPMRPQVLEAMLPYYSQLAAGNPSSIHRLGIRARQGVEEARAVLARVLGCAPEEVYFTSGGTEADNWAVKGLSAARGEGRVVTSAVEHHAVLYTCQYLEKTGREVVYVPVDGQGVLALDALEAALDDGPVSLLSVMHGNNETGTLQPIAAAGHLARERGIPFHVDAVQSFGKVPITPAELNADAISLSAHKINGPKGVGALYRRAGTPIEALLHGGEHEGGVRAGTENVAGIIGFARAAELRVEEMAQEVPRWRSWRDRLEAGVLAAIDDVHINGRGRRGERLANTSSLAFAGVESEAVVMGLDLAGIAVSSGSACASGAADPSHVLMAMGMQPRLAASSVRFSTGWGNDEEQIDRVVETLGDVIGRLRALSVYS